MNEKDWKQCDYHSRQIINTLLDSMKHNYELLKESKDNASQVKANLGRLVEKLEIIRSDKS